MKPKENENKSNPEQSSNIPEAETPVEAQKRSAPVKEEKKPAVARKRASGKENYAARKQEAPISDFIEKVLVIKRVTKVTKGGKKLSFSALVVVGDTKGRVGFSLGKAGDVATAIRKALGSAKKRMISISLKGRTIPHEIIGVCGGATVLLKPASEGTGVIASGPVRAVCDGVGIHDILTKCHRSNNPTNVVKATLNGLSRLKTAVNQQTGTLNASS